MTDVDKLLDEVLAGKRPEEILGAEGVLQELTKRLVERLRASSTRVEIKRVITRRGIRVRGMDRGTTAN